MMDPIDPMSDEKNGHHGDEGKLTVWDWFMSLIRGRPISIPEEDEMLVVSEAERAPDIEEAAPQKLALSFTPAKFRLPVAIVLALFAQFGLEGGSVGLSVALYIAAALLIGWAVLAGDFDLEPLKTLATKAEALSIRLPYLLASAVFAGLTFLTAGNNRFDAATVLLWMASIFSLMIALWEGDGGYPQLWKKLKSWIRNPTLRLSVELWGLLVLFGFLVALYFRFAQIESLPNEMVSDHAEKLLDVVDVLNGQNSIYFPRNTGREALQFYMAAATAKFLGTGITYLTLKIGTVLAGVVILPFIYLLGKEVGRREVGLAAMVLAGIAYWPNVISRVGLRFPLYPLFVAPAFYYLVRGVRLRRRNDFILCGLAVGIGLHGYSPARVLPVAIAVGVGLYLLHKDARGQRTAFIGYLVATGLVALVVLMPLLRIAVQRPDDVILRMMTRVGSVEQEIAGSPLLIFAKNIYKALIMFAWDNGEVWVNSIPGRPALDWITGAFFHLGVLILAVRYAMKRYWVDLFILISIPILQLPSTLSIAFPGENPATNRTAGAIIPVFIAAGMGVGAIPAWARSQWQSRKSMLIASLSVFLLILLAARINYNLVFVEYKELFRRSAWNTSEIGDVIKGFAESVGDYDTAHVVAYPHWVDTRLVGMNAGRPTIDYAISRERLVELVLEDRAQLLILNTEDAESLNYLQALYPSGKISGWHSDLEGKSFIIFFVPAGAESDPSVLAEPES